VQVAENRRQADDGNDPQDEQRAAGRPLLQGERIIGGGDDILRSFPVPSHHRPEGSHRWKMNGMGKNVFDSTKSKVWTEVAKESQNIPLRKGYWVDILGDICHHDHCVFYFMRLIPVISSEIL
jgi:hypothetical protein